MRLPTNNISYIAYCLYEYVYIDIDSYIYYVL